MNSLFSKEVLAPILSNILDKPDLRAFCINEVFYSYRQLGDYVSKIRDALKKRVHGENPIVLIANDDIETYASIFAIWLEGKCYVPLHPNQPIDRCLGIVDQISPSLILDSSEETHYSIDVALMTKPLLFEKDCLELQDMCYDNQLAYILFTSGSTGTPKGVMITKGNLGTFMDSFWNTGINISSGDRCLQCFDLTFDVSVQCFLTALTRGACIYTVPHGQIKYIYVSKLIEDHKLTFGAMAPSMLRYMKLYFSEIDATSLKTCILTAESCPLKLIEEWSQCANNAEIYDFYGPTEATIYCTYYKLNRGSENKSYNGIISIGKPMSNVVAIIIDENGNIVHSGEKGELCVSGGHVTPGYLNSSKINEACFFEKELNGTELRFYRTGDLCYMESDGNIMYSGRLDQQTKIQGFRVELGEIEFHARAFLGNKNAVAIAFENDESITEIALFIESDTTNSKEIVDFLRSKLPSYMIPTRVLCESVFPLNANDKIDKKRLKESVTHG